VEIDFEAPDFEEEKEEVSENFNRSMLEFNNKRPHELENCRAVSKIGLKIEVKG